MDIFEYELCRCHQQELTEQAHHGLAVAARRRERRVARRLARAARVLVLPLRKVAPARSARAQRDVA